jgi:hypothetical protein
MIANGEVTEERALQFAHGFLHDNAEHIYMPPRAKVWINAKGVIGKSLNLMPREFQD